ncbi:oligosaccharide flippase family protein [Tsuneonella troitsensis]|uniref:oligosaccharide flippase family protein n=1 Tax=Tsuneonella troitsensis TaxID=292222 RepID=UPI0009FA20B0|nr:oligosaccharide flippase family protein [Tsuneonella troitsensis]
MGSPVPRAHIAQLVSSLRSRPIAGQVGWVIVPFGLQQIIRLATQIVLARLLAPEMFGLMLLVNALRTGVELLSDIGIGQSVVRSPNGDARDFLRVAWTLQVLRGALLSITVFALAWPIASLYDQPDLLPILFVISPIFLISGLLSPSLFTMQRHLMLKRRAAYDFASLIFQCVCTIALAAVMQSVWALVWGLLLSTIFTTVLSYAFGGGKYSRLAWSRQHATEILHFGKWIFLSTAIYYAATSFDRMYFVGVLSLALAGVFGVARTFSDMLGALAQRAGSYLVFPKIAALRERRSQAAPRLRIARRNTLALVAVVTGIGMAVSDEFIFIAYDARYHAAAFIIPVLLFGVWFSILSSFADAMLMGCGRPAPGAWSNGAKFAVMLVGLPFALASGSMVEALAVLVLAEAVRWLVLTWSSHDEGFARLSDDIYLTVGVLAVAIIAKLLLGSAGVVPTPAEWWHSRSLLHG